MIMPRLAVMGFVLLYACECLAVDHDIRTHFELDGARNVVEGYSQKLVLQITPEAQFFFDENTEATVIGRLHVDADDRLESGVPRQEEASRYSKRATFGNHGDAELREFYFKKRFDQDYLSVGKQQVVWGAADGLRVLDVVNPFSYREALLDDFDKARIPIWMLNYLHNLGSETDLQLLWIPDLTFNDFPDGDGREPSDYTITFTKFLPSIPAGVKGVRVLGVNRPGNSIDHSDVGLRLTTRFGDADVTFNYLYQYDDNPVIYRRIVDLNDVPVLDIWQQYDRTQIFGSTLSDAVSSTVVLRSEIGYINGRRVLRDDVSRNDGVLKTDELSYVLGLDWSGLSDTLLSVQWFRRALIDDVPDLAMDKIDNTLSFLVKSRFMNDTLTLDFMMLHNLNEHDEVYRPRITYALKDGVNVWVGADIFSGKPEGMFGQFSDKDRVYAGVEWYW